MHAQRGSRVKPIKPVAIIVACAIGFAFPLEAAADDCATRSFTVVAELDGSTTPISDELQAYITANAGAYNQIVGLGGTDIGWGAGDALNESVPFTLEFPTFRTICEATLSLDYTTTGPVSDHLLFADNDSVWTPFQQCDYFGNPEFASLPASGSGTVVFELGNLGTNFGYAGTFGTTDLRGLLLDGKLDIISHDDCIIHRVELRVTGRDLTGDTNNDCDVDLGDLAEVLSQFGQSNSGLSGDMDGDGNVDLSDLAIVLRLFGIRCS